MSVADGIDAQAFNRMGRTDEQIAATEARKEQEMYRAGHADASRVYAGKTPDQIAYAMHEHQTRPTWRGDGPYERGMRDALAALLNQPAVVMTKDGPQALLPGITPPDETKGDVAQRRMF